MTASSLLRSCTYITFFLSSVRAFSVTFDTPTQCDPFAVSWTGGQAPFEILLTPKFSPLVNISVPTSAFSNGRGSYTIPQLPMVNGTEFLLTMSDGTGFGTGGTTTVLTVGPPVENNNCNTKLSQDFYFQLPDALKQCDVYEFTGYDGAIQPITITGLIPGGIDTLLHPPTGTSYNWTVDVQEGTQLLFIITDSQGRQGGASDLLTVAASTDGSCLVANVPSSTVSAPSQPTSNQSTLGSDTKNPDIGAIVGATVGGAAFIVLLVIFGICCRRRAFRSSNLASSLVHQSDIPQRMDDGYEVKPDGHVEQDFSSPYKIDYTGNGNHSHLVNSYQTLPTGLAAPVHPVILTDASAGTFSVNDPHVSGQIQPSRLRPNMADYSTGYGDAKSLSTSSASRKTASQDYSSSYQTYSVGHPALPIQPTYNTVNNPHLPLNPMPHSHLNTTIERFARDVEAGGDDAPTRPDTRGMVDLPPLYATRQHLASQSVSAPQEKIPQI